LGLLDILVPFVFLAIASTVADSLLKELDTVVFLACFFSTTGLAVVVLLVDFGSCSFDRSLGKTIF
jgi:hypothetical protein